MVGHDDGTADEPKAGCLELLPLGPDGLGERGIGQAGEFFSMQRVRKYSALGDE